MPEYRGYANREPTSFTEVGSFLIKDRAVGGGSISAWYFCLKDDAAMENYCPLLVDLRDRPCLVVGGGRVALRKVRTLLAAQAKVLVASPSLNKELEGLARAGKIKWLKDTYQSEQLDGIFLALGCSNSRGTNSRLADDCRSRGLLVNISDNPELCNFFFPAVVSRGPLSVAISTEGKSPALARRLRAGLEKSFTDDHAEFIHFLGSLRPFILSVVKDPKHRRDLFRELAGEEFFSLFCRLTPEQRQEKARELINTYCG